jgi:hypothetical protein
MPFKLATRIEGTSCSIAIDRVAAHVLLVRIEGHDVGEFGDTPMRCLDAALPEAHASSLFLDTRQVRGVTMNVSAAWAQWLAARRSRLASVHMLTASRYVTISAEFVRRFAELEPIMSLYDDARAFEARVVSAIAAER